MDPDSAPGKEYEIPLDRARQDAAPGGGGDAGRPPNGSQAPAFGAGLAPADSAGGADEGSGTGKAPGRTDGDNGAAGNGSGGAESSPTADAPGTFPSEPDAQVAVKTAGSSEGGVGPTLTFSALGVGTLLLGGLVGLLLRRRSRLGT